MKRLTNKFAFVTGADSGIGKQIAIAFAKEGADVALAYHSDKEGAAETAWAVRQYGQKAYTFRLDVTKEKEVDVVLDKAIAKMGRLDILVNNAGVNGSNIPIAEMDTKVFDLTLRTNLYGIFFACRWFARYIKGKKRRARIINVSSIHEEIAVAGNIDYNSSKGALRMFTKTLALELAETGTTVNNIGPGMILTPMNQKVIDDEKLRREMEQHIPAERAGKPEEIAKLAIFLASDDADYITGATYFMDGGLMINTGQGA
jgi:glucose 1-dehydrogenase